MQIKGPSETEKARKASKTGSAKKTGDSSFESLVSDTAATAQGATAMGAGGISPATSLEALLSLQGSGDATEGRARAKQRADEMLDRLDDIRMGLLSGGIPVQSLKDLSRLIAQKRENFDDPRLQEVLDEIDLRAQVELAKLDSAKR